MRYIDIVWQFLAAYDAGRWGSLLLGGAMAGVVACIWMLLRWRRRRDVADDALGDEADAYDPALAALDAAVAADPMAVEPRRQRGLHLFGKGDYDLAIQDFHVWVARAPKSAEAYRYRGEAWCRLGLDDLALADYRHALNLEPANAAARANLEALAAAPADAKRPRPAMLSLTQLFAKELRQAGPQKSARAPLPHAR